MQSAALQESDQGVDARTAFVGRQAIYDGRLNVYGYELLFRSGGQGDARFRDGDQATSSVLVSSFLDIGLERICERHMAFINLTRRFLLEDISLPFPPGQVVLEVLEDVEVDAELVQGVARLRAQGFTIALDDFIYAPRYDPLLPLADIIKVDVRLLDEEGVTDHVNILKPRGLKLLAEKVETHEEFEHYCGLGFDYFQGYFLSRPVVISGRRLAHNKLNTLQLLARLQDPGVDIGEVESLVSRDPSLGYKLFRYINSAFFALPRAVNSIQRAVLLLGLGQLKRWITLLALAEVDDKPVELMRIALVRARMCELICPGSGDEASTYFTAGLFSTLDLLMDAPLAELLGGLPLAPELSGALLAGEGRIGAALRCARAYEDCDFEQVAFEGRTPEELREAYTSAVEWSFQVAAGIS